jgi:uncharacterized protein (DUF1697 family)
LSDRQVALLRGINVGKAKRVAMADLRAAVESLGFGGVRTLLNSGNVVYTAPGTPPDEAAERIEAAVRERTGVSSRVTVLSAAEVGEAVAACPWRSEPSLNPSRLLVAALRDPAERARFAPLEEGDWGTSRFAAAGRFAYVWCPDGVLESPLPDALARALGDRVTTRNWATLLKLQALVEG